MSLFGFLGSLVGAGASIWGGSQAASGARRAAKIGAKASTKNVRYAARKNLAWQRRFAQKGIRWRVKDAKKAGLHPLAALGAQLPGFSPSFVAGDAGNILAQGGMAAAQAEGNAISNAGQDIGRAISSLGDVDQRNDAFIQKAQALQLENMSLQNAALASRISLDQQAGNPPAMPASASRYIIDGQGQTVRASPVVAGVTDNPMSRSGYTGGRSEPAPINDVGFINAGDGRFVPVMSKDAKERLEDDWLGGIQHYARTRLIDPIVDVVKSAPPWLKPGPGEYVHYNPLTGAYTIQKDTNYGKTKDWP